jgi:hypothetical protein
MYPSCYVLNGEATNADFVVSGLNRPGLKPMIYHTQVEHASHYNTAVVFYI